MERLYRLAPRARGFRNVWRRAWSALGTHCLDGVGEPLSNRRARHGARHRGRLGRTQRRMLSCPGRGKFKRAAAMFGGHLDNVSLHLAGKGYLHKAELDVHFYGEGGRVAFDLSVYDGGCAEPVTGRLASEFCALLFEDERSFERPIPTLRGRLPRISAAGRAVAISTKSIINVFIVRSHRLAAGNRAVRHLTLPR